MKVKCFLSIPIFGGKLTLDYQIIIMSALKFINMTVYFCVILQGHEGFDPQKMKPRIFLRSCYEELNPKKRNWSYFLCRPLWWEIFFMSLELVL